MKGKVITLRVSEETYKYLKRCAKVNETTISEVIRKKIELQKQWKEPR